MKARSRFYLFLFIVLAVAGIVCLLTLPMFHTGEIIVENTNRRNEYIMKAIENLTREKSVFLANRKAIKTEIEKDPYLVYEGITYRLPNKLVIKVNEREPKFYVTHLNTYLYMTYDGYVINAQRDKLNANIPEVKGLAINSFAVREKINIYDSYQLTELSMILEKLIKIGMEARISEIDITDVVNIKMKTTEGNEIIFGTGEQIERKIEWMYSILNTLSKDNTKRYIIDVSAPENPTYQPVDSDQKQVLQ